MDISINRPSRTVKQVAFYFSACLLLACPLAAWYTDSWGEVLPAWIEILTSPSPLVTDYYALGSLPATFLNAGVCGLTCWALMAALKAECYPSTWAGFFLVIAHCFYGLNFVNMWPSILGCFVFCHVLKTSFRDNLDLAMFSTAFGPFMSELLFRYPANNGFLIPLGGGHFLNPLGIFIVILVGYFLGFAIPAMLPGALLLHRGYNLYNGGLAFGLLGMLVYAFLYRTMGVAGVSAVAWTDPAYVSLLHGSFALFCNLFFGLSFLGCILIGFFVNGRSFRGFRVLLNDCSHRANFFQDYGCGPTWINLGTYGLFMLAYINAVVFLTDGAGFTGPTCGVIFAAMSFAASGQHIKNVWPVLGGYVVLSLGVAVFCFMFEMDVPWTLSTQGYINGAAFATGLCPFTGCYNRKIGMLAGLMSAVMCTTTSAMHGGLMLYNGGLTAGITALILTPMLDYYYRGNSRSR